MLESKNTLKTLGLTTLVSTAFLLGGCFDSSSSGSSSSSNDSNTTPEVDDDFDPNETNEDGELVVAQAVEDYIQSTQKVQFAVRLADSLTWNFSDEDRKKLFNGSINDDDVTPDFQCSSGDSTYKLDSVTTDGFKINATFSSCKLTYEKGDDGRDYWQNILKDGESVTVDGEVTLNIPTMTEETVSGTVKYALDYTFDEIKYTLLAETELAADLKPTSLPDGMTTTLSLDGLEDIFTEEGKIELSWGDIKVTLDSYKITNAAFDDEEYTDYNWINSLDTIQAVYARTAGTDKIAFNLAATSEHKESGSDGHKGLNSFLTYKLTAGDFEQLIKGNINRRADQQDNLELESTSGGCNGTFPPSTTADEWCEAN